MYKFLLCFLIGILIYNYINSKDGFINISDKLNLLTDNICRNLP